MCFSIVTTSSADKLSQGLGIYSHLPAYRDLNLLNKKLKSIDKKTLQVDLGIESEKVNPHNFFKAPEAVGFDKKIFSHTFSDVLVAHAGRVSFMPMRYRLRPSNSTSEIPSKYNTFNARIESLEERQTWSRLLGKKHGVVLLKSFYEWVEDQSGKKRMIEFSPKETDFLIVPCLWDEWLSPSKQLYFRSFAIVTTEPTEFILAHGHDRSPVFLEEEHMMDWLLVANHHPKESVGLLNGIRPRLAAKII